MGKQGSGGISIPQLPSNIKDAANALAGMGAQSLANFQATDPSVQGIINTLIGTPTYPTSPGTVGTTPGGGMVSSPSTIPTAKTTAVTPPTAASTGYPGFGPSAIPLPTAKPPTTPTATPKPPTTAPATTATKPPPGVVPPSYVPPLTNLGVDPAKMIQQGVAMATGGGSLAGPGPAMPTPINFAQFQKGLNLSIDKQTQAQTNAMDAFYGQAGLGNSSMAVSARQNIQDQNLIMKSELGMELAKLSFDEQAQVAGLSIQEQQVQLAGRLGMAQLGLDTAQLGANMMQMQQNMGLQMGEFGLQVAQFRTGLNQLNLGNALSEIGLAADIYNRQAANSLQAQQLNMQATGNFGVGIGMLGSSLFGALGSVFGGPVGGLLGSSLGGIAAQGISGADRAIA